jgi:hypothetical protein
MKNDVLDGDYLRRFLTRTLGKIQSRGIEHSVGVRNKSKRQEVEKREKTGRIETKSLICLRHATPKANPTSPAAVSRPKLLDNDEERKFRLKQILIGNEYIWSSVGN